MSIPVVEEVAALRAIVDGWRRDGVSVALVPTMGSLHAGHVSLVEAARATADRVVATVFVNPTQFAAGEDFGAYPRDLAADHARVAAAGADLVYAPEVGTMYPAGFCTAVTVGGPALAGLEDAVRPRHFAGVAIVVTKLLHQVRPDAALFGEKDWQQLKVIERLVRDLDIEVSVQGLPTVRAPDGLALSSRNAYLDAAERARAPTLYRALKGCAAAIEGGAAIAAALATARDALSAAGFVVDYLELREAATLLPLAERRDGAARLLAAARLGATRLIDNLHVDARATCPPAENLSGSAGS